jgi:hypothetical protein
MQSISSIISRLPQQGSNQCISVSTSVQRATTLSWRSSVRITLLLTSTPCHGTSYRHPHIDITDAYATGDVAGAPELFVCHPF